MSRFPTMIMLVGGCAVGICRGQQPSPLDLCTVAANIKTLNGQQIRVTAFLGAGAEQDVLYDPKCRNGEPLVYVSFKPRVAGEMKALRRIVQKRRYALVTVEGTIHGGESVKVDPKLPDWLKDRFKDASKRYGHLDSVEMMIKVGRVADAKDVDDGVRPKAALQNEVQHARSAATHHSGVPSLHFEAQHKRSLQEAYGAVSGSKKLPARLRELRQSFFIPPPLVTNNLVTFLHGGWWPFVPFGIRFWRIDSNCIAPHRPTILQLSAGHHQFLARFVQTTPEYMLALNFSGFRDRIDICTQIHERYSLRGYSLPICSNTTCNRNENRFRFESTLRFPVDFESEKAYIA